MKNKIPILIFISASFAIIGLLGPEYFRYYQHTSSMSPTLKVGETYVINPFSFIIKQPKRGDIIILKGNDDNHEFKGAKRIIGLPNEIIRIHKGHIYANNKSVSDQFYDIPITSFKNYLKLDSNEYYVVGDNINNSLDSRHYGPIKSRNIHAKLIP